MVKTITSLFMESISCFPLVFESPFSKGGFRGIFEVSNADAFLRIPLFPLFETGMYAMRFLPNSIGRAKSPAL